MGPWTGPRPAADPGPGPDADILEAKAILGEGDFTTIKLGANMKRNYDDWLQAQAAPAREWCSMPGCQVKTDNGGELDGEFYCADCLGTLKAKAILGEGDSKGGI